MSPCEVRRIGNDGMAIICTGRTRRQSCATCGAPAPFLCDYPIKRQNVLRNDRIADEMGTCDRPVCGAHAHAVGPDRHYCGVHFRMEQQKGATDATP